MPGVNPNADDWLANKIKEFDDRLLALETQPVLNNASIDDGTTTLFDANGNAILILGKQANGHHGSRLQMPDGHLLALTTAEDGQVFPRIPISLYPNGSALIGNRMRPGTDQPTYTELWRGDFDCIGTLIDFDIFVFPNGGDMDWRILVYEYGAASNPVAGIAHELTNTQRGGPTATITIPATSLVTGTGTNPVGRSMTMRIEALLHPGGPTTADIAVNAPPINHN